MIFTSSRSTPSYCNTRRIRYSLIWLVVYISLPWIISEATQIHLLLLYLLFSPTAIFPLSSHLAFKFAITIVMITSAVGLPEFQPISLTQFLTELNYRVRDTFFKVRGFLPQTGQVIIVNLNAKCIEEVGQWPWPRTLIARALNHLQADGAKVIGFDMVFSDDDRASLGPWFDRLVATGLVTPSPTSAGQWVIPGEQAKVLLLKEWYDRLVKEGILANSLIADATIAANILSAQEAIVKGFLTYVGTSEEDPQKAMTLMARQSRELFFLPIEILDKISFSENIPIIPNNDDYLGEQFKQKNVVAGAFLLFGKDLGEKLNYQVGSLLKGSVPITYADTALPYLRHGSFAVGNSSSIQSGIANQSLFNVVPDSLGIARYYSLAFYSPFPSESLEPKPGITGEQLLDMDNYVTKKSIDYNMVPSLALEMIRVGNEYDEMEVSVSNKGRLLHLRRDSKIVKEGYLPSGYTIPLDIQGDMLLNYLNNGDAYEASNYLPYSKEYYFTYISLSDVIKGNFPAETFKGKYVLIGSTDPAQHDFIPSAYKSNHSGLAIHANALDMILSQRYLVDDIENSILYIFLANLFGGMLWAMLIAYADAIFATGLGFIFFTFLPAFSYYCFAHLGFTFDVVYLWISMLMVLLSGILANYFTVGKESRFVAKQFSSMVSGDLLNKIRQDPQSISLEGHKAQVSIMFSDIAGFTSISEKLPPADLVKVLNDYFTPMTDIILEHGGFIDKFIGDCIMACWGVPYPDAHHALQACYACLAQQAALRVIAKKIHAVYGIWIHARMGVASGEVSAALMGSQQRKNYTVMGDTVNLASRLEPACKDYSVQILISESTYLAVKEYIVARCIDKIIVKGKTVAIPIYELIGKVGKVEDKKIEIIALFDTALYFYWKKEWDLALINLDKVLSLDPEDYPTHVLIKKIKHYKLFPPPDNWQGETIKTTK